MKNLITVLLLLVSNLVFAIAPTPSIGPLQGKLNDAFQTLKDNGINPTIMQSTLENVQLFSGPGSVNFNVNFTPENPLGTTTWMPTIQQNFLESVINSGNYTFSIGAANPINHTINIVNDKTGNFNHDLFKMNLHTTYGELNAYNLTLGVSGGGGNASETFGFCTSNNTSTDKKCLKNALNSGYKKIVNRSDDMFFNTDVLMDIGFMVGESIKEGLEDVKLGMQNMAYQTAASELGQTAEDVCAPGIPVDACNAIGRKFVVYSTAVTSLDANPEDYNLGLDSLLDISGALFEIGEIRLDYENPTNGMLLLENVQWHLLD